MFGDLASNDYAAANSKSSECMSKGMSEGMRLILWDSYHEWVYQALIRWYFLSGAHYRYD